MSAGLQISPTIDTNFLFSLWPNQIIKIALIKLTDTQRGKQTVRQEQWKWGKSKQTRKARCGQKIGLKLISLVFCFPFSLLFRPTHSYGPKYLPNRFSYGRKSTIRISFTVGSHSSIKRTICWPKNPLPPETREKKWSLIWCFVGLESFLCMRDLIENLT